MASILAAIAGYGEKFTRLFYKDSYTISDGTRASRKDGPLSQNIPKPISPENDPAHLNHRHTLTSIHQDSQRFAGAFHRFLERGQTFLREASPEDIQQLNRQLEPMTQSLVDDADELQAAGPDQWPGLTVFWLRGLMRVSGFLSVMYHLPTMAKLRGAHETSAPPSFTHDQGPIFDKNMHTTKKVLSNPALHHVMPDIMLLWGLDPSHTPVSPQFLERVILDIEAMENNLAPPTYVVPDEYHSMMTSRFPAPSWLPKRGILRGLMQSGDMPGRFPDDEESESAPHEVSDRWGHSLLSSQAHIGRPGRRVAMARRREPVQSQTPLESLSRVSRAKVDKNAGRRSSVSSTMLSSLQRSIGGRQTMERRAWNHGLNKTAPSTLPQLNDRRRIKSVRSTVDDVSRHDTPRLSEITPIDVPSAMESAESPLSLEPEYGDRSPTHEPSEPTPEPPGGETDAISIWETADAVRPNWGLDDFELEDEPLSIHHRYQSLYEPTWRTEEDKKKGLMRLFSEPTPEGLRQSDDSRLEIELQKQQEAARLAEEKKRAAEKAMKEAEERAKRELQERLAKSGGLRVPKKQFVGPISADWTQRALNTLRRPPGDSLARTGEGVDLRRHDFCKVVPETEWLNDEIVNGSLNWLDKAINEAAGVKNVKSQTRKCLALSSFFYKRLKDQGVQGTSRMLSRNGVRKENLLNVDTILVPICESMHWTLLVIRPTRRTVAHMDSLNPRGSPFNTNLGMAWMKDVLQEKFVDEEWSVVRHDAPRQTNGWDCGVHTITNAMCVGLGLSPADSYSAGDMPLQRLRIACALLNGGFTGEFDLRMY